MEKIQIEKFDEIIFNNLDCESDGFQSTYNYENVLKAMKITHLKALTECSIWADYIPNGNKICDDYIKELDELLK